MQSVTQSASSASSPPIFVRLAAMRGVEEGYRAASPSERRSYHEGLAFHSLLTESERSALARRNRCDLATESCSAWDEKCRELVGSMLAFAARACSVRLQLVTSVAVREDVAVMALTASGSVIELGRPKADGTRRLTYRCDGRRDEAEVTLAEPLAVGRPARFGTSRTSEILLVARGSELPAEVGAPLAAPSRSSMMERLRTLIEAAERAREDAVCARLQEEAVELACAIQAQVAPDGGFAVRELAGFTTCSGSRYQVMQYGALDLVRRAPDELACVWMHDADIGPQTVTPGAPLVIFYAGPHGRRKIAFVYRIASVEAL